VLRRAQADAQEWRPLALQVAEFQAATPARFHVMPRGQHLGPALPPPLPAGQLTEAKARCTAPSPPTPQFNASQGCLREAAHVCMHAHTQ